MEPGIHEEIAMCHLPKRDKSRGETGSVDSGQSETDITHGGGTPSKKEGVGETAAAIQFEIGHRQNDLIINKERLRDKSNIPESKIVGNVIKATSGPDDEVSPHTSCAKSENSSDVEGISRTGPEDEQDDRPRAEVRSRAGETDDDSIEEIVSPDLQTSLAQVDRMCVTRKTRRSTDFKRDLKQPIVHEVLDGDGTELFTVLEKIRRTKEGCLVDDFVVELEVLDRAGAEVLHMRRESEVLRETMQVFVPPDQPAGHVRELWSVFTDNFYVLDAEGQVAIMVQGNMTTCWNRFEMGFKLLSPDQTTQLGSIEPHYASRLHKAAGDEEAYDHFAVSFPVELDHKLKAVLLGTCFLIDILSFYCWNN